MTLLNTLTQWALVLTLCALSWAIVVRFAGHNFLIYMPWRNLGCFGVAWYFNAECMFYGDIYHTRYSGFPWFSVFYVHSGRKYRWSAKLGYRETDI